MLNELGKIERAHNTRHDIHDTHDTHDDTNKAKVTATLLVEKKAIELGFVLAQRDEAGHDALQQIARLLRGQLRGQRVGNGVARLA